MNKIICIVILCLISLPLMAISKDIKGSEDHSLISRYPGSIIMTYQFRDFDEYTLPLSPRNSKSKFDKVKELEGQVTRIGYKIKQNTSVLKVYKNFEIALKKSGFNTLFSCKKEACGKDNWRKFFVKTKVYALQRSARMLSAYNKINGNDVYVMLFVGEAHNNTIAIGLDIVEVKSMETDLIGVDVNSLQKKLDADGKIPLYGIRFEVGKANLLESSEKEIKVLADFLNKNKKIRIYVVGHTDDTGNPDHNLTLSSQRAQSVIKRLVGKYKIAQKRLAAFGAGSYSPVGSNMNEEGKALNRRVEIVKRL